MMRVRRVLLEPFENGMLITVWNVSVSYLQPLYLRLKRAYKPRVL